VLIVAPSPLFCRDLAGVVYSDHSGPSAQGTGVVALSTKLGLVNIHYQKPIKQDFSSDRCWDVGAVWSVKTKQVGEHEELIRAHCTGKMDADVHSAWIAVRNYIRSVANAVGEDLGYQATRRRPVTVKMGDVSVDVAGYLDFGASGMCLDLRRRINSSTIVINSSADCHFNPDLAFRVEQIQPDVWQVSSVQPAPLK
jgi:hypothetical protein